MSELASRLRRLEVALSTASAERLNSLRIDHVFALLAMRAVMGDYGSLHFPTADDADDAIERAIAEQFRDGCGAAFHPLGEDEPVRIFADGQFEDRVLALKELNRRQHWTDEARAAVALAHGLDKSGDESD